MKIDENFSILLLSESHFTLSKSQLVRDLLNTIETHCKQICKKLKDCNKKIRKKLT